MEPQSAKNKNTTVAADLAPHSGQILREVSGKLPFKPSRARLRADGVKRYALSEAVWHRQNPMEPIDIFSRP